MQIDAVVFDVNETLSDMDPLRQRFTDVGLPAHTLDSWFAGVLRDGFAVAATGGFRTFAAIAAGNLRAMLTEEQIAHVLAGFRALDTHPDVAPGMRALASAGVRIVTLTNGAAAMSEPMLERAGVLGLLEHRLSVEDVRCWKPAAPAYRHAADTLGVPLERLALVAVHPWDVHGAQAAGMRGVWVNRDGSAYPDYVPTPDVEVPDLRDLAGVLATAQE